MAFKDTVSLEFLERFGAAWNAHDVDGVMAHMTSDCLFQASVGDQEDGARFEGAAAARRGIVAFFETYPDAHFEALGAFIAGDRGVSEWLFSGTMRDGTKVRALGCDIFTFADGKIKVKNAFRKQCP